jgi:hypothetical protein
MVVGVNSRISYTVPPVPKLIIPFPGTVNCILVDCAGVELEVAF